MPRRILRTVGRTALISGTATAVAGRVAHRQRQNLAKTHAPQPENSAAQEPSHSHDDIAESLERLAKLKASGALSEKEFKAAKAKLLS
jgi:Short C-terminal domain